VYNGNKVVLVVALNSVTATAVTDRLIEIFSQTGIAYQILSDQGAQFTGHLIKKLCKDLYIKRLHTTAYYPQTNGMLECLHGTLEAVITKAKTKG